MARPPIIPIRAQGRKPARMDQLPPGVAELIQGQARQAASIQLGTAPCPMAGKGHDPLCSMFFMMNGANSVGGVIHGSPDGLIAIGKRFIQRGENVKLAGRTDIVEAPDGSLMNGGKLGCEVCGGKPHAELDEGEIKKNHDAFALKMREQKEKELGEALQGQSSDDSPLPTTDDGRAVVASIEDAAKLEQQIRASDATDQKALESEFGAGDESGSTSFADTVGLTPKETKVDDLDPAKAKTDPKIVITDK